MDAGHRLRLRRAVLGPGSSDGGPCRADERGALTPRLFGVPLVSLPFAVPTGFGYHRAKEHSLAPEQFFDPTEHPHRRRNPLTGKYVLVSPHRTQRPWQGAEEAAPREDLPSYDPDCYLCPGNSRKSGHTNPNYKTTYVFDNDFRALLDGVPPAPASDHPLLHLEGVEGTNRVLCFSPRHDLTLARMDVVGIRRVVDLWGDETEALGRTYRWVQMFENRGEAMGASNPHPHGQVWAQKTLPNEAVTEDFHQREYAKGDPSGGRSLLLDYALLESARGDRTVLENDDWIVVVPYWAFWPYETLVLPKFRVQRMPEVPSAQRDSLAEALKGLLVKYDNLFQTPFPYSMGWHGAPFAPGDHSHWQLHAHYYPPLLRSATVRKFMVGYELLSEAQRDLTAERAAETLRELSELHYREDESDG